jgi:hypothetical protein
MGYDFSIWVLRPGSEGQYPLDSSGVGESTVETDLDQNRLNQRLGEFPGIQRNGASNWRWDVPEGGSLDLSAGSWGVHIDTHARWPAVLEIYLHVRDAYPRAVLCDPQTGLWHDERSFRDFLAAPSRRWPDPKPEEYSLERLNIMVDAMAQGDRSIGLGLLRIGARASPVVSRLIALLDHPQNQVRIDAIMALEHIGPAAFAAVPKLVALARASREPPLPTLAFRTLGRIGVPAPDAVAVILDTLRHGAMHDRWTALKSLFQMKQDALALPLLFDSMAQADVAPPSCRATAFADLFDQVNDLDGAVRGLLPLFEQRDATRRLVAAIAMDALARRHPCCEVLAAQALQNGWERVRRIAVTTLARLPRSQSVTDRLEGCRRGDPDREVRARADWALAYGVIRHDPQRD